MVTKKRQRKKEARCRGVAGAGNGQRGRGSGAAVPPVPAGLGDDHLGADLMEPPPELGSLQLHLHPGPRLPTLRAALGPLFCGEEKREEAARVAPGVPPPPRGSPPLPTRLRGPAVLPGAGPAVLVGTLWHLPLGRTSHQSFHREGVSPGAERHPPPGAGVPPGRLRDSGGRRRLHPGRYPATLVRSPPGSRRGAAATVRSSCIQLSQ